MNLNIVHVCGRLTRQPETRTMPSGKSVTTFGVATNYVYKTEAGAKVEEVEYHNVVAFGKTADNIAKYFGKGDEIYIQGRLKTQSWEKEGHKNYRTEIIADRFDFGQKSRANQQSRSNSQATDDFSQPQIDDEEIQIENIPF